MLALLRARYRAWRQRLAHADAVYARRHRDTQRDGVVVLAPLERGR
jgi:hypothetical protein